MAVKTFNTRILLKNDTSANWASVANSFTPLKGEFIWDSTQKNFKIGDGSTTVGSIKFVVPIPDGTTITGASSNNLETWSVGAIGSDKVNLLTGYTAPASGTAYTAPASTDSLNAAIAKLAAGVAAAQAAGVLSIDTLAGAFTTGNGIQATNNVLEAVATGYLTVTSNGIAIDSNKIGGSTSGNLATIDQVNATVTDVATGATNGTISVTKNGTATEVSVYGLGSAAYTPASDYATAAQGGKADTALQSISHGTDGSYVTTTIGTKDSNNDQTVGVAVTVQAMSNADSTHMGLAEASDVKTYVTNAINGAIDSEMTFKGVTASLPSTPENGDMYKASGAITVSSGDDGQGVGFTTKAGDTIIYKDVDGAADNGWYLIPSADDVEDTWRAISVNGTEVLGSGTSTGGVDFVSGSSNPVSVNYNNGAIKIEHTLLDVNSGNTNPWTSQGAVKIMTDDWGHVRTDGAITSSDIAIVSGDPGYAQGATVSTALQALNTSITNAGITIDGHKGAITTGDGLTDVAADGGSFGIKLKTGSENGLGVDSNGLTMNIADESTAANASYGTVKVTAGNGLSITTGVISYSHAGGSATIASESNDIVTLKAGVTQATGTGVVSNSSGSDITLAKVAKTGKIEDLTQTDMIIFDCGSSTVNVAS